MSLYYLLLFLVPLIWIFSRSKGQKKYYSIVVSFILIAFSAFRGYDVGGDLINYIPLFEEIDKESWLELFKSYNKYGLIFQSIIKLCCIISNNTTWILFILSLINISIPAYFINKFSKIPWLSFFLYIALAYYTNTFNSLRASMALAFGMLGIMYLLKNSKSTAFIWFVIAFEVHKTIFPIFLLFYFVNKKPTFWKISIPIISCIVIANTLGLLGFMDILNFYNQLNAYGGANDLEMGGSGYGLLLLDILLTFGCYFLVRNSKISHREDFFLWLMCLATCLQAAAPIYSLITRIALFFSIYIIVLLPNIIYRNFKTPDRYYVSVMIVMLSSVYFKVFVMTPSLETHTNSQHTIPYYFFWEKKPRI